METYVLGPNAARKLKGLFAGQGKSERRNTGTPGVAFDSEYANPYAVQWAQSANNGAGSWIIWLPGDALLVVDGLKIDVRKDLEPVGGDYPDGWYLLGNVIEHDGTLYLDITFPDPDDEAAAKEPTAAFSNGETSDDEGDGRKVIHVSICDVATDSSTGARSVRQFVTSMISIDNGGETCLCGDGVSSEWLKANGLKIMLQGYPGTGDGMDEVDNCGLYFTTVSGRTDQDGNKIPAKIILSVKDKLTGENWAAKTMTVPISGGGTKIVHFLGCDDVDLTKIASGILSVTLDGQTGIRVNQNTANGAYTGNILNTGVIGLVGQDSSQAANGTITTKGANGSGLKVTVTRSAEPTEQAPLSNGTLEVDIDGRGEGDSFGTKELQLEGKKVATIFGTANVNIKQKKIAAGTGVEVAEANGVVTISATGAATSGFTGSRTVLADTRYSGHYLQKRFYTETWKDGVLESSTLGNWITYHTAVEETA